MLRNQKYRAHQRNGLTIGIRMQERNPVVFELVLLFISPERVLSIPLVTVSESAARLYIGRNNIHIEYSRFTVDARCSTPAPCVGLVRIPVLAKVGTPDVFKDRSLRLLVYRLHSCSIAHYYPVEF